MLARSKLSKQDKNQLQNPIFIDEYYGANNS